MPNLNSTWHYSISPVIILRIINLIDYWRCSISDKYLYERRTRYNLENRPIPGAHQKLSLYYSKIEKYLLNMLLRLLRKFSKILWMWYLQE